MVTARRAALTQAHAYAPRPKVIEPCSVRTANDPASPNSVIMRTAQPDQAGRGIRSDPESASVVIRINRWRRCPSAASLFVYQTHHQLAAEHGGVGRQATMAKMDRLAPISSLPSCAW
jgi:hypothetical protein